jgi:hypothetical protein
MRCKMSFVLTELRAFIAKSAKTKANDEDEVFELTNFDIQEVSTVDHPANEQPFLIVKAKTMKTTNALQEILGNGTGEFLSKLDAGQEGDDLQGEEGEQNAEGDASKLQLSEAVKSTTLQNLGTVIKALIEVAKVVDGAEVAAEGGDKLPDDLRTVLASSSQVLAKMLGIETGGEGKPDGQQGEGQAGKSKTDTTKAKLGDFQATLDTIGSVITNLRGALGGEGKGEGKTEAGGDKPSGEGKTGDDGIAKALTDITEILKQQGTAITELRGTVGLPASRQAESTRKGKGSGEKTTKAGGDDFDGWPMDMNEGRRQRGRR